MIVCLGWDADGATFADARDMRADVAGKPVYLGIAINADNVLKLKPQNILLNLPLAPRA